MEFKCPHCRKDFVIDEEHSGKMIECAACGNLFHAPSQKVCPECRDLLEPGVVVCVRCGYNLAAGRKMETSIHVDDPTPVWLKLLRLVYDVMPGLFRPLLVLSFLASIVLAVVLAYLGLFVLFCGAFLAGIGICSAALMVYAQGVTLLLAGEFQLMKSAMADFTEVQMWVFGIVVFGPCALLFFTMLFIGKYINSN